MELTSPKIIKEVLSKYHLKPLKTQGQNFLIDKNILSKIINACDLKKDDVVLEVGAGLGVLTQELCKKVKKVIAIEKDKKIFSILKDNLKEFKNIKLIEGDILKFLEANLSNFNLPKNYKLVANLPYYITSRFIRMVLELKNKPKDIILMIQKEVAQRICAKPPKMNLLAVSVQFYSKPKILFYVSKNCFYPKPKVDSVIIKITPQTLENLTSQYFREIFFSIVKKGFSYPRKQLLNNLAELKTQNNIKLTKKQITLWLLKNNITPTQRPETLSIKDWINLTLTFYEFILTKNYNK